MASSGQVKFGLLLSALLGLLAAVQVSFVPSVSGETHSPPQWKSQKMDSLLSLLCAQTSPSPSPPSSAHRVRPSDVTALSAAGLPRSGRHEVLKVLNRVSEYFSMFNPGLISLLPEETANGTLSEQAFNAAVTIKSQQILDHRLEWKLVLLLVSVDDLCACPGQASSAVASAVQQFEQTLQTLRAQLQHTLVNAAVWVQGSDTRDPQSERVCHCRETDNMASLRFLKVALAQSLQESLERHLEARPWYSNGENFAIALQETPIDISPERTSGEKAPPAGPRMVDTDKLAVQLWVNLLQPMTGQPGLHSEDIFDIPCPREYQPFLRTKRNSPPKLHPQARLLSTGDSVSPSDVRSDLSCRHRSPSPSIPTSVHALRPADIKVVAALGDSLTAANGAGGSSTNILDVLTQYRGLSWSIGGDKNLTTVTTLPNIFREFNSNLVGFSVGTGNENSIGTFLNRAVPGANSDDVAVQARALVDRMKSDARIDFHNDWKVITIFIGANDLCDHCTDSVYFSAGNLVAHVHQALDILHQEVPHALVNLVEILDILPLRELHKDKTLKCPTWLVNSVCRCVVKPSEGSAELQKLRDLNQAYQRGMQELVESGRYDTHPNFTVVLQPFLRGLMLPLLEDGRPDRSYFAADCFHLSQKSHSLMARALWNNMLEPVGNKTKTQDFTDDLPIKCPSEDSPFLRTYLNSNYSYRGPTPTPPPVMNWGSNMDCVNNWPSDPVPSSVHRLRPADIKVVASLGDSITAGFGAKSKNLLQLKNEYRGVSWSIGGDQTLETVTTLPNILRKFNPSLHGFSRGLGTSKSGFNMAVSGAKASDIPAQVEHLIQALRASKDVDFDNDWKLVTLFIGGNDLCAYCEDRAAMSPQNYSNYLKESLDLLYREVPRTLVNVLEILQIDGLRRIRSDSPGCSLLQTMVCPCVLTPGEDSLELSELKRINREFQAETDQLVLGGRYDRREDFTVVIQPYFQNSIVPVNSDGKPDVSFFSVDCFHFSERGHAEMAISLWNNMLEPVGSKQTYNNFTQDRNKLRCPTEDQPFIFTRFNSFAQVPTGDSAIPHPTTWPPNGPCTGLPVWATVLIGLVGLLFGMNMMFMASRYGVHRMMKTKTTASSVELTGTKFQ